ncbi:MAG: DUF2971 domain-containing protein [Oceanospirillaceae bacterium]|nr:DUF2971 domain-containing protein [Oceanospirillaceae bacterium]
MNKIYRIRTIESILTKHKELEKQEIYMSPPEKLNDPMEGILDIIWNGDEVLWENLFKHYTECLVKFCLFIQLNKDDEIKLEQISTSYNINLEYVEIKKIIENSFNLILKTEYVDKTIKYLAHNKLKLNINELKFLFYSCNPIIYYSIDNAINNNKQNAKIINDYTNSHLNKSLEKLKTGVYKQDYSTKFTKNRLKNTLTNSSIYSNEPNLSKLIFEDFPDFHSENLKNLIHPSWIAACFTGEKGIVDSALWGNYSDKHEGVALIFKNDFHNNLNIINPDITVFKSWRKMTYSKKIPEINFFDSISTGSHKDMINYWFYDKNKNPSKTPPPEPRDYYFLIHLIDKLITKTKHWKYEDEYRFLIASRKKSKDGIKLKYEFSSLIGIIFGINTSDKDKQSIIEIIDKKCNENNLLYFPFYQAYYDRESGDILYQQDPFLTIEKNP